MPRTVLPVNSLCILLNSILNNKAVSRIISFVSRNCSLVGYLLPRDAIHIAQHCVVRLSVRFTPVWRRNS